MLLESTRSTLEVFSYEMQANQSSSGSEVTKCEVYLDINSASLRTQGLPSGTRMWLKPHAKELGACVMPEERRLFRATEALGRGSRKQGSKWYRD